MPVPEAMPVRRAFRVFRVFAVISDPKGIRAVKDLRAIWGHRDLRDQLDR